jgi:hypothetical protein
MHSVLWASILASAGVAVVTMRGVPVRAKVRTRAAHLGRSVKARLSSLQAVIITEAICPLSGSLREQVMGEAASRA